jgi:large subunit ribosomal protein L35Ae
LTHVKSPLTICRKRNTNPGTSLLKLEGVDDSTAAQWYCGKRVACTYTWNQDNAIWRQTINASADVYRAQRAIQGSKIRAIWGKVTRPHGNSGVVRAKFRSNLPPKTFGASVRVMLYPSSI